MHKHSLVLIYITSLFSVLRLKEHKLAPEHEVLTPGLWDTHTPAKLTEPLVCRRTREPECEWHLEA